MPAVPTRRRRFAAPLLGVVLGLGLLAGCAGQRAPGDYGSGVEKDFVTGCTGTAGSDAEDEEGTAIEDVKTYCQCAYDALSAEDGLDFDDFKKVNDDLVEDPGPLPESVTKFFETDSFQECVGA